MTETMKCTLSYERGTANSLHELIETLASGEAPLFAWAEPDVLCVDLDNQGGRRTDFQPLVRGFPVWPTDLALVEMRYFWAHSALHAVANPHGCRWVKVHEKQGSSERDGESLVDRQTYPVFTLRDRARFGLDGEASDINELTIIEYSNEGRTVGWRLIEKD